MKQVSRQSLGVFIAITSSCVGGTAAAVTRYMAENTDPLTLALLRWSLGFFCVLPVALVLRSRWPQRSDWLAIACLGVAFFGLFFILYNVAVSYTTAARASLALATLPLQTMLVGGLFGVEALTPRKSAGVGIAVVGVLGALASGLSTAPPGAWRGELIMIGAAFCMACYNVWSRPLIEKIEPARFSHGRNGIWCCGTYRGRCTDHLAILAWIWRPAMDWRRLSRGRWRRTRIHPLGVGAPEGDAHTRGKHHDRQSHSSGRAGERARG